MKKFFSLFAALLFVGSMMATDFTLSSAASVSKDGITVSFAKGAGSTAPAWYDNGLRLYVKNTITITSTANITEISFNWEKQGKKDFNTQCTASTGSYTHPSAAGVGTWTGSATSVTFTLGDVSGAQLQLNTFSVTTSGGGTPTPTLSVDPAVIDFGTVNKNAIVANKTVEVTFANLTGSVTYSGLTSPFTASGAISATGDEITIAANTATVGNYSQTLTVQSAADSKSVEVTVKMNVVEPFNGQKLTFDFVTHPTGWPTAKADAAAGNYTYTLNEVDYTFILSKEGDGIYMTGTSGTGGALLMASGNTLGLPALSGYKLVKVEGTLNSAGSPSIASQVSITDGSDVVSGGAAQTWDTKGAAKIYNLSGTEENKVYYLSVSNKNCQMMTLVLYYEEAEAAAVAKPTISGEASFEDEVEVTISAAAGAAIYYTLDGTDPTDASTEYTAAFTLNATTTVKAIAKIGSDVSAVAEKTFTKLEKQTCAEVYAMSKNDAVSLNDVTVTYVNNRNVWVKDATGAMLLYLPANATWSAGSVLSGVKGTLDIYNGLYEVVPSAAQVAAVTATAGAAPAPEVLTAVTESDMNKYIILKGASVTKFVSKNATLTIGGADYALYDKFNSGFEFNTEKKYDVVALVSIYNSNLQLNFISAEVSTTTALDNAAVEGKAVKFIENGQLFIEKAGVRYNVMGQIIK